METVWLWCCCGDQKAHCVLWLAWRRNNRSSHLNIIHTAQCVQQVVGCDITMKNIEWGFESATARKSEHQSKLTFPQGQTPLLLYPIQSLYPLNQLGQTPFLWPSWWCRGGWGSEANDHEPITVCSWVGVCDLQCRARYCLGGRVNRGRLGIVGASACVSVLLLRLIFSYWSLLCCRTHAYWTNGHIFLCVCGCVSTASACFVCTMQSISAVLLWSSILMNGSPFVCVLGYQLQHIGAITNSRVAQYIS